MAVKLSENQTKNLINASVKSVSCKLHRLYDRSLAFENSKRGSSTTTSIDRIHQTSQYCGRGRKFLANGNAYGRLRINMAPKMKKES
jgi:hypothetical protein